MSWDRRRTNAGLGQSVAQDAAAFQYGPGMYDGLVSYQDVNGNTVNPGSTIDALGNLALTTNQSIAQTTGGTSGVSSVVATGQAAVAGVSTTLVLGGLALALAIWRGWV